MHHAKPSVCPFCPEIPPADVGVARREPFNGCSSEEELGVHGIRRRPQPIERLPKFTRTRRQIAPLPLRPTRHFVNPPAKSPDVEVVDSVVDACPSKYGTTGNGKRGDAI